MAVTQKSDVCSGSCCKFRALFVAVCDLTGPWWGSDYLQDPMQLVQSWRWSCEVLYGIWQPDYVTLLGIVYVAESTRQSLLVYYTLITKL